MKHMKAILVALAFVGGAVLAGNADATPSSSASGICDLLGCTAGETKCADGTAEDPNGRVYEFTCYTTIEPE